MAQGAAWALACALPTRPSFGVLSFLVKNPRAVSEATTKVGRRARVRRCVQNSEEFFGGKEIFPNFFRPSRLSENSALIPEYDDTPESASTDSV